MKELSVFTSRFTTVTSSFSQLKAIFTQIRILKCYEYVITLYTFWLQPRKKVLPACPLLCLSEVLSHSSGWHEVLAAASESRLQWTLSYRVTDWHWLVLPPTFLFYRPSETCCAVPSVTYTGQTSAHKWRPQISDNPDETVYYISLLFKRMFLDKDNGIYYLYTQSHLIRLCPMSALKINNLGLHLGLVSICVWIQFSDSDIVMVNTVLWEVDYICKDVLYVVWYWSQSHVNHEALHHWSMWDMHSHQNHNDHEHTMTQI